MGRSRVVPGCAPFCVKSVSSSSSPSTRVARGALAGGPADAGEGEPVPCVARHRFWAVWSLASGYVPRSGLWRTGLSPRHGASWALRAVEQWAGRAAHIPAGTGDATTTRHQRRGGAGRTACSVKLIRLKSVWHCIVGACASRLQCCALSGLAALPRGELRKDCWECRSRRQMGTALV